MIGRAAGNCGDINGISGLLWMCYTKEVAESTGGCGRQTDHLVKHAIVDTTRRILGVRLITIATNNVPLSEFGANWAMWTISWPFLGHRTCAHVRWHGSDNSCQKDKSSQTESISVVVSSFVGSCAMSKQKGGAKFQAWQGLPQRGVGAFQLWALDSKFVKP